MNLFYEESGQLKVATIVQKNATNYQVDTLHGKRSKIKGINALFEFEDNIALFLEEANDLAKEIDISFLWEVCPVDEFLAHEIAEEYYGNIPSNKQLAAIYMALYSAPIYFYKKSKNYFKAASAETLEQALLAVERKKQQEAQVDTWIVDIENGQLPQKIKEDLSSILYQPDKQSLTYKAFVKAADKLKLSPLSLALNLGGVTSIADYLESGFIYQNFPFGISSPDIAMGKIMELNFADEKIRAFSIDDTDTTEIDDALSVINLENGNKQVGIHIAVPSIAIQDDSDIEKHIFQRQSTVYYPGNKITMLPDNWLQEFSLDEGSYRPCLSLYFEVNQEGQYSIIKTVLEQVYIEHNLRIQDIEMPFDDNLNTENIALFPHHGTMNYLYQFAIQLQKQRGKYEENPSKRYDYSIVIDDKKYVSVISRERGSPIDTLVSEMMLLANSSWAKLLDEHHVNGIFRSQSRVGKVKMQIQAEEHSGIGVSHYAWFTSPLRRNADYINQRQLLSIIDERFTARFTANDSMLHAVLRNFESTYAAYADFQRKMEAYWSIQYIKQNHIQELQGILLKDDLVRIEGLPLLGRVSGVPFDLLSKTKVQLTLVDMDELAQTIALRYIKAVLD